MNRSIQLASALVLLLGALSACTTAKLEARLEANPQCKDVYNAKTGALMPCPGSDRSFYVAAGLEAPRQAKVAPATNAAGSTTTSSTTSSATMAQPASTAPAVGQAPITTSTAVAPSPVATQSDCKPTIHKKTGGMLPCPPQD